jgi:hypothetical protein
MAQVTLMIFGIWLSRSKSLLQLYRFIVYRISWCCRYGDGIAGGVGLYWLIGTGDSGAPIALEMKLRASESFASLAQEAEWALAYKQYE